MSDSTNSSWGGRFSEPTDAFVARYTASVTFDQRMYRQDIQGSIAHARMLCKVGVLTEQERDDILRGLEEVRIEIERGEFEWSVALEDVHMNIEAALTKKIGITGKKLHTGRSRNDQVATDIRLYLRDEIDVINAELTRLQQGLVELAEKEADTIMPGFTHLQTAQPVTFGHHLLAWNAMLTRDFDRLQDCRKRINQMPLGAAALAGTTYPIDRHYTAELLGFDAPTENSLDSVSDRDFAIEFTSAASLIMMHMSRFSEELVLWASAQFQFVDLPDRFCTGSSIMPQKKNPDVPELVRGKTGRVYGHMISLLTLMKSQPLAYNKDNQEDKEPLFDTVDTLRETLLIFAEMIGGELNPQTGERAGGLQVNAQAMQAAVQRGYATATDLADYLVKRGMPFRDAHEVVAHAVKAAQTLGVDLAELSLAQLQQLAPSVQADVQQALTAIGAMQARQTTGGTAPEQVRLQLTRHLQRLNGQ